MLCICGWKILVDMETRWIQCHSLVIYAFDQFPHKSKQPVKIIHRLHTDCQHICDKDDSFL